MKHYNSHPSVKFVSGICLVLFFLGSLFWAKEQDTFFRQWFTLEAAGIESFKCVVVMPKQVRRFPVIVYAHGYGGTLINDGHDLRQMAELGFAVISLEYKQSSEIAFPAEMDALRNFIARQKWANTNYIAWVGFSMGANRMLDLELRHPDQAPQIYVDLSGQGIGGEKLAFSLPITNHPSSKNLQILLIHGDQDEVFPMDDTKRLFSTLQSNAWPVILKAIPGAPHGMGQERGVVFRNIGEYCLSHMVGVGAWKSYHSVASTQAETLPFWLFLLPALIWIVGWSICWYLCRIVLPNRIKLMRSEIAFRWLVVLLSILALAETSVHLFMPYFPVNELSIPIARIFLIRPNEHAAFEFLAAQHIWDGQKLKTLLDQVELSGYNRRLVDWQLDETMYCDFVLHPVITENSGESLNWRRPLWEEFYPRIRHESSPEDAAKIVVRHLRERVTIVSLPNQPQNVPDIWLKQITDEAGFEIIYVAALRSIGVPARMDSNRHAEYYDGSKWQIAPKPCVASW